MKRLAVVVLASLLLPRPGHSVTMEEAVSLALTNNHRVKDFRQRTEAQERRVDSGKSPSRSGGCGGATGSGLASPLLSASGSSSPAGLFLRKLAASPLRS